jgi:hypothetical protein
LQAPICVAAVIKKLLQNQADVVVPASLCLCMKCCGASGQLHFATASEKATPTYKMQSAQLWRIRTIHVWIFTQLLL